LTVHQVQTWAAGPPGRGREDEGRTSLAHFERYFTYEEAQERVPWVRGIFERIHLVLHALEFPSRLGSPFQESYGLIRGEDRQTYQILESIPQIARPETLIETLTNEGKQDLLKGLVRGLKKEGLIVQDVRRGLVDFPAWKDGREVFLCYELADGDRIGHWHELDTGYAGRREIQDDDEM
jgi:hypothetical protein